MGIGRRARLREFGADDGQDFWGGGCDGVGEGLDVCADETDSEGGTELLRESDGGAEGFEGGFREGGAGFVGMGEE